jgi:hypothetical protein
VGNCGFEMLALFVRRSRRLFALTSRSIIFIGSSVFVRPTQSASQEPCAQDHNAWVTNALKKIESIKPGMTRQDLLKVFTTEGGLSTGLRRTFISRDCPYFKVVVEFKAAPGPDRDNAGFLNSVEDNRDIIVKVSQPYLQFAIGD